MAAFHSKRRRQPASGYFDICKGSPIRRWANLYAKCQLASTLDMIPAQFEELVRSAFSDSPKLRTESAEVDAAFEPQSDTERFWWQMSPTFVNPENADRLSPEGFRFFLPLYLVATLQFEWCTPGPLLRILYTPGVPEKEPSASGWWLRFHRWKAFVDELTDQQKHVIRTWLEIIQEREHVHSLHHDEIREMLANYWAAF
jgi:hypothetical protein